MEKIRSGQAFLYREGGLHSTIIDVRTKNKIRGSILNQALTESIKRYPYFASKLVEKNGDYYIADNRNISMIARKNSYKPLGSVSAGYHLVEVSYNNNHIYISFHHAICDGRGVKPFVETLIYYYFCILKNKTFKADNIIKADSPMFEDETIEPFGYTKYEVNEYKPVDVVKDGFALPECKNQGEERYKFDIEVDSESFMEYARSVNATPSILLSYLFSKSIYLNNKEIDKPIVTSLAADMRFELGVPHTHKNCVRSIYFPFYKENWNADTREICTEFRKTLKSQRDENYVRGMANSFIALSDKLDSMNSFEEKKNFMSFFDTMTINTYVLSYLGVFDFGECNEFIDAVHFYGGGIRGITINMTSTTGKFNINIIQNIDADKYAVTFMKLLDELEIHYKSDGRMQFSTVKDRTHRTAQYQAERFQIMN